MFELISRFIGLRAILLGMFAATVLFTIGHFASSSEFFSLPKLNMFNPAQSLIGKGRVPRGSVKEFQAWKVLHSVAFVSADADGKIIVAYQDYQFGLRLYYLEGFSRAAGPYLAGLLKNAPLTIVTRWEAFGERSERLSPFLPFGAIWPHYWWNNLWRASAVCSRRPRLRRENGI